MKRIIQTTAISLLIVGLYIGCSKSADSPAPSTPTTPTTPSAPAPTANFTYAGEGLAPSTVTFTNTSSNSTSYSWDFGDNTTSTATNPTHTYRVGGVFTVKLTATGAGGTNSTTKTVNITAPTKYTITKITLDSVPFLKTDGKTWDTGLEALGTGGTYPDIYFKITDINNVDLWNKMRSSKFDDISQVKLPLTYPLSTPYQSSDLKQNIYISVMDADNFGDEEVGYVGYNISALTSGANSYPTSVTLSYKGTKITINLTWQ
jgi:PKD repeat protein